MLPSCAPKSHCHSRVELFATCLSRPTSQRADSGRGLKRLGSRNRSTWQENAGEWRQK